MRAETLHRLTSDFTLLTSVLWGTPSSSHKELSELLLALIDSSLRICCRGESTEPNNEAMEGEGTNVPTLRTPNPELKDLQTTTEEVLLLKLSTDFLSYGLLTELERAVLEARNPHMFMRGNSVVPLLIEMIGSRYIQPVMQSRLDLLLGQLCQLNAEDGGGNCRHISALVDALVNSDGMPPVALVEEIGEGGSEVVAPLSTEEKQRIESFLDELWSAVSSTMPQWPLSFCWALSSVPRWVALQSPTSPLFTSPSSFSERDSCVSSMLATTVMLRIVSPLVMRYPTERCDALRGMDMFDPQLNCCRRRVTFVTKLLQKAAYHQPMSTVAHSTDIDTNATESESCQISRFINGSVVTLSTKMDAFWKVLCDRIELRSRFEQLSRAALKQEAMCSRSITMEPSGCTPLRPPSQQSAKLNQPSCTAPSSCGASPFSDAGGAHDGTASRRLFEFLDRHATSVIGSMNLRRPLAAPIHQYRLLNFTHYCARRLAGHGTFFSANPSGHETPGPVPSVQGSDSPAAANVTEVLHDPSSPDETKKGVSPPPPSRRHTTTSLSSTFAFIRRKLGKNSPQASPLVTTTEPTSQQAKEESPQSQSAVDFGENTTESSFVMVERADSNSGQQQGVMQQGDMTPHSPQDRQKLIMFQELVSHGCRCRAQPETMNYAHCFGTIVGNTDTLAASATSPIASSLDDEERLIALIVLHADQLTEAANLFFAQRDRNLAVLERSLPITSKYTAKNASGLQEASLDAAAHLCFLIDVVMHATMGEQMPSTAQSPPQYHQQFQVLFFPPQEPLKCGCGTQWIKDIFHHILPVAVLQRCAQVVLGQPGHVAKPFRLGKLFQNKDHSFTLSTNPLVKGFKMPSVTDAIEQVVAGDHTSMVAGSSALQELITRRSSRPSALFHRIPLSLREWLYATVEQRSVQRRPQLLTTSPTASHPSSQMQSPQTNGSATSFPPSLSTSFALGQDHQWGSGAATEGHVVLQQAGDVWPLSTQRDVLELLWSIAGSVDDNEVNAVGIPNQMLSSFRKKALEWFHTFSLDIVEHLATPSKLARANNGMRSRASTMGATTMTVEHLAPKISVYHCTWFGFIVDGVHPVDMAEFETQFYSVLCEKIPHGGEQRQHDPTSSLSLLSRSATALHAEGEATSSGTPESSPALRSGAPPQGSPSILSLCDVSLKHISCRCLWRMLLFNLCRSLVVLLHRSVLVEGASSTMTLWQRWKSIHKRWAIECQELERQNTDDDKDGTTVTNNTEVFSEKATDTIQSDRPQDASEGSTLLQLENVTPGVGYDDDRVRALRTLASRLGRTLSSYTDSADLECVALVVDCCEFLTQITTKSSSVASGFTEEDIVLRLADGTARLIKGKGLHGSSARVASAVRWGLEDDLALRDIAAAIVAHGQTVLCSAQQASFSRLLGADEGVPLSHSQRLSGMPLIFSTATLNDSGAEVASRASAEGNASPNE